MPPLSSVVLVVPTCERDMLSRVPCGRIAPRPFRLKRSVLMYSLPREKPPPNGTRKGEEVSIRRLRARNWILTVRIWVGVRRITRTVA